jgi:nucleoside-diphosphate-sugar epimerase
MRVLVTGATGVVGRWAFEGLLGVNHEIVAVSRGRRQIGGAAEIQANLLDPGIVAAIRCLRSEVGAAATGAIEEGLAESYAW